MPLVTLSDVQAVTRTSFSPEEEAAVQVLIDTMEGELEDFVNRPLVPRAITDERVRVRLDGRAFFRHSPVVSIQSVSHYDTGLTVAASTYSIYPGGLSLGSTSLAYDIVVDYTAGLSAPDNVGLKSIMLARLTRIAAKVHDDALGVGSLGQEGYNAAYLAEGWTDQELRLAERRRRRTVRA